jgi:peptidoglycan/LPS O-acetylase OafA/YrhL
MRFPIRYLAFPVQPGQQPALDGLRAFAILLVMARHGLRAEGAPAPEVQIGGWDIWAPFLNGWVGVDLFFVLSGFLIAGSLLRGGRPGIAAYLAGRALRIVPAYYAVLLIVAFGLVPYYPVPAENWGFRLAYHLLFLQDYLPADFNVVFWSLGVEEKFYLLAPFLVLPLLAYRRAGRALLVLVGLIALAPALRALTALIFPWVADYPWFFMLFRSPFHASMDALLVGVLAAWVLHRSDLAGAARRHAGAIFWAGAAGFAALISPAEMLARITSYDKIVQSSLIAFACGAMVLGAAAGGGPARLLGAAWLRVTARLSYSLYLLHLVLIPLALRLLDGAFPGLAGGQRFGAFLLVYAALSLTAALALHYLVEKPGLVLKARLTRLPPVSGRARVSQTHNGRTVDAVPVTPFARRFRLGFVRDGECRRGPVGR